MASEQIKTFLPCFLSPHYCNPPPAAKTYELRLPTFLIRIASFRDGYLMSGGFVGSPVWPGGIRSLTRVYQREFYFDIDTQFVFSLS
jgi:hypothetical protein